MKRRIIAMFLAVLMLLTMLPASAMAAESGTCGQNLTWKLDGSGTLTVSGTGEMDNYSAYSSTAPWYNGRSSVKSVVIEDGVTSIGSYAFSFLRQVTSVKIGSGVKNIGVYAFYNCVSLSNAILGGSVESIGSYAFYGCSALAGISVPGSVKSIGDYAFYNCTALTVIALPEGVTQIGSFAFAKCGSLVEAYIPASVTEIGTSAFDATPWFASLGEFGAVNGILIKYQGGNPNVVIPDSITRINSLAFYNINWLSSVRLGNGVVSLGRYAFSGCTGLRSVVFGDGITGISGDEFKNSNELTEITFGKNFNSIEKNALSGYSKLRSVIFTGGVPAGLDGESFNTQAADFAIFAPEVHASWTASPLYNSAAGTWAGYKIVIQHNYISTVTAPTCTERGYTIHACTVCGDSYVDSYTAPLGHDYMDGCCTRCGDKDPAYWVTPKAPELTASIIASSGKIKLTWAKVDHAAGYEVYSSTDNKHFSLLKTVSGTSLKNTSAEAGTKYYYKVRAFNKSGTVGEYSEVVSAVCVCKAPVVTLKNDAATGKVIVSWAKVSGAAGYEVYRAASKDGTYKKLRTVTGTSYTDTGAKAGSTYYYKVKAIGKIPAASSDFSAAKYRTCDLARPTVSISTSNGHPKLTWSKIQGATKYEVYVATSKNGDYTKLVKTGKTSLKNTSAKAGTTYYYKVRALCATASAAGAYSSVVSIKAK